MLENVDLDRFVEEESDEVSSVIPPLDIVAFNELRSCADIYRMYEKGQIDINPDFQRGEVWKPRAQTLFVDSLMKQLPIPSLCISLDYKTQKRLVIDGLQRITTIIKFLAPDSKWKLSKVDDVDNRISGKTVSYIKENEHDLYTILENVVIPITVIRCDYAKRDHMQYLFQIFYRLNSGGNKLYNQEIRNCIFQGDFNNLLKELARTKEWLSFTDSTSEQVDKARFNHEERILRFFSFYEKYEVYRGKLASFLNDFMDIYKNAKLEKITEMKKLFVETLSVANKITTKLESKNVADAVLVGIAKNITNILGRDDDTINKCFKTLLSEEEFSTESLQEGLGATDKVKKRIEKAISIFGHG